MTKCEHCGGQVFLEEQTDGTTDRVCIQCGRRETLNWQPVERMPGERGPVTNVEKRSHKKKVSV